MRIDEYGFLEKVSSSDKLPSTVLEWSDIQLRLVKNTDFSLFKDSPAFYDDDAEINLCERAKSRKLLGKGRLAFYADGIRAGDKFFPFENISDIAIHGIRNLQIYLSDGTMYMVKGKEKTNMVKYMVCGYHIMHGIRKEEDEFFGY